MRIDLEAISRIAAASMTREELLAGGYLALAKSGELFRFGYCVVFWARIGRAGSEVLEYKPRSVPGRPSLVPRVTARTYAEQRAIHLALGLGVVGPGQEWRHRADSAPTLFDHLET